MTDKFYLLRQGSPEKKWAAPICKACGTLVRATQYFDFDTGFFCCGKPGCVEKWKRELGKEDADESEAIEQDAQRVRQSYKLDTPTQEEVDELMTDDD